MAMKKLITIMPMKKMRVMVTVSTTTTRVTNGDNANLVHGQSGFRVMDLMIR